MNTVKRILKTASAAVALISAGVLTACAPASVTGEELQPAVPGSSYVLTSSKINVAAHSDSQQMHGECADGFHVAGKWGGGGIVTSLPNSRPVQFGGQWTASGLAAHGSYISIGATIGQNQNGTDSNGKPTYQVIDVRLSNTSLLSSHTGWFTWTCNSN